MISAAVRFLSLARRNAAPPPPACRQADIDDWLTAAGPGAADVRDFLAWAARQGHCQPFDIPRPPRRAGTAIGDSQRWDLVTRLLHDDSIPVTDRIAGCLVLLFGQNMTRAAAITTSQVTRHGCDVYVQFGQHEVPIPSALGMLLLTLIADGKPNTGTGSPAVGPWLFPGLLPGQPITPARLTRAAPRPRHPRPGRTPRSAHRLAAPAARRRARRHPRTTTPKRRQMDARRRS